MKLMLNKSYKYFKQSSVSDHPLTLVNSADQSTMEAGRRILIVDDEPGNIRFLGDLLIGKGYRIYLANSGEMALEIATTIRPDLILLDIFMPPGMDGLETCRRLKARDETYLIPIIFLTAQAGEETVLQAFDSGGADYVTKPFDARVLLARVATHTELSILSHNLELALVQRTRELHAANENLRRLALEVSLAEEREKKRLAGDLHDSPMQKLALGRIQLDMAAGTKDPPTLRDHLAEGRQLVRDAIQELRFLQFELSPPLLYQSGLEAALTWLAAHASSRWHMPFSFVSCGQLPGPGEELTIVLFQFARELVLNVVKHAKAKQGWIHLGGDEENVSLTVDDDGNGFTSDVARKETPTVSYKGFGLASIRERLRLLGGRVQVTSNNRGSRVAIRVPRDAGSVLGQPARP